MHRRSIVGVLLVVALVILLTGRALAHAEMISADPRDGAVLDRPPAKITLVFSEEIDAAQSGFTIIDTSGATVGQGKLDTNDLDHKTLSGALNAGVGNGTYTVKWVAVTPDDNGKTEGTISFSVGVTQAQPSAVVQPTVVRQPARPQPAATAQASGTAPPASPPTNLPATGGDGMLDADWMFGGGAILLLIGLAVVRRSQTLRKW